MTFFQVKRYFEARHDLLDKRTYSLLMHKLQTRKTNTKFHV